MLRQLWRLARPLDVGGVRMSAPAIYAEKHGDHWEVERARETGYEGVACVDDAARLAILLLRAHDAHGLPWAFDWARDTVAFVLYQQQPDGDFANFILDWDGTPNLTGPTSAHPGSPWLARALWALATAYRVTSDPLYRERYNAALAVLPEEVEYADMYSWVVLSLLEMHRAAPEARFLSRAADICARLLEHHRDGVLLNSAYEAEPHLWGYQQPAALALTGAVLGEHAWVEAAAASVELRLAPHVEAGFDRPHVLPYEVGSVAADLDALHRVTGVPRYAVLAASAREWFHGRNTAGRPVYDRERGMVYDGIDDGVINPNSGSESNIEGGLALFAELPWRAWRFP